LSFGSAPALVLGAGPSLDNILDALPRRFGEAHRLPQTRPFRIVCVDTCLPALRERGIIPDLAVILESQHWNLAGVTGLSGWNVSAALDLSALPRSGTVLSGSRFLFCTPWTKLNIFARLEAAGLLPTALPPLGSVGLSAVAIARRLTRGTIITAGLDFSFTLDSYHARSTPGHKGRLRRQNRFTGLLNTDAAFNDAAFGAVSKAGGTVLSSPAMRRYRDLFQREFAGVPRLFDLDGSGLPLGITSLSPDAAFNALSVPGAENAGSRSCTAAPAEADNTRTEQLQAFITSECNRLILLRNMLTAAVPMDHAALEMLIDECDYLWAHFPDYAASGLRPGRAELETGAAISFLKRLRVEIDPFVKLWEMTLREISA
jgi:hypothetical protein